MNFHILTLFPEMIEHAAGTSILGRAIQKGCIKLNISNIRDFSANKHKRVDDYPYGGGAGMVIEAEPVFRAVKAAKESAGENTRVIYLTPQAKVLEQTTVEELASEESLILLCGHYEGIDERVLEEVVTDYVSIGDYVLTGGELPALVLMDAVSRFVPGVLSNDESAQVESLQDNLLEYPHYTRPEVWHDKHVPPVLLTGDHKKITAWRYEASVERTLQRRPDLMDVSKNLLAVSYGSEKALEFAKLICETASNYGTVLDYNRAKLRKEKRRLDGRDILIFITDKNICEEELGDVIKNIRGDENSLIYIEIGNADTGADSLIKIKEAFAKKNILLLEKLCITEAEFLEQLDKLALDIRKKINAINKKYE